MTVSRPGGGQPLIAFWEDVKQLFQDPLALEAIAAVEKATEYAAPRPPSLRSQVILAMAAFKAGDKERANRAFDEAIAAREKVGLVDREHDRLQAEAAALLGR